MPFERSQELPEPNVKIQSRPSSDPGGSRKLPFSALLNPRSSKDKVICLNWSIGCRRRAVHLPHASPPRSSRVQTRFCLPAASQYMTIVHATNKVDEDLYVFHSAPSHQILLLILLPRPHQIIRQLAIGASSTSTLRARSPVHVQTCLVHRFPHGGGLHICVSARA